jgi:hypothetical protein
MHFVVEQFEPHYSLQDVGSFKMKFVNDFAL